MSSQTYAFAGPRQIDAAGRFCFYQDCNAVDSGASAKIQIFIDGTLHGVLRPGDQIRLSSPANRWEIVPISPSLSGNVIIGNAETIPGTVPGAIEVIDASIRKSQDGNQVYSGYARVGGAGAFPYVGVFAESSSSYALRRIAINTGGSSTGRVVGYITSTAPAAPTASRLAKNKLLGSAAESLRMYAGDSATTNGSGGDLGTIVTDIGGPYMANWSMVELPLTSPLILPSGRGLVFISQVAAATLSVFIDAEEVAAPIIPQA